MKVILSRRSVTVVFAACTLLTLLVAIAHFALVGFGVYGDGLGYYAPLRSILFDHDLVVTNEYEYFATTHSRFGGGSRWPHAIPHYSKYTIGMAVILAPFYLVAHVVVSVLVFLGVLNVEANGLSWPYELFYCVGSISLGVAGLVCTYRACRLFFGRMASLLAVLGVWAASPLTYYVFIENSMSHAISQGLVSALVYFSLHGIVRQKRPNGLLLGTLLGLATLVRPQDALFGIVPATALLVSFDRQDIKATLSAAIWMVASFLTLLSAQLIAYFTQYGTVINSPYMIEGSSSTSGSSFNWFTPALLDVLFSGHRGLFIWHPLTLISITGLILLGRRNMTVAITAAVALFLQIYLVAAWHCWWQGASLGSRMLSCSTLIFALGLAAVWDRLRNRLVAAPVILTLFFIAWNSLITAQYMSGMIPPEKPVTARTLLENQVRVVPYFIKHLRDR